MTETTLARAMKEARASLFPRAAKLVPVLQVTGTLNSKTIDTELINGRRETLKWIQKRSQKLPSSAWNFETFELEYGGTGAISLKDGSTDYWVARLVDPDKNVAGRTWTTEISIVKSDNVARFGLKQIVQTREEEPEFVPAIPGVLRQIINACNLEVDNRVLEETAWVLEQEREIDELLSQIYNPNRQLPIYVVTLDESEIDSRNAILNVQDLAKRCIGLAHVVVLPGPLTFVLTDQLDKQFSVFRGAVRTYLPNFDQYSDSPYDHPLAMPDRITNWGDRGANDFVDFLVKRAASSSSRYQKRRNFIPSFTRVKEAVGRQQRETSANEGAEFEEQLELANLAIEEIEKQRDEWEDLALVAEQENQREQERNSKLESELFRLRHRIVELEEHLISRSGKSVEIEIPSSYGEVKEWSERYLGDRVILTGKAFRAAKAAEFENVSLSYEALLMMANEYWKMKVYGGEERIRIFEKKLKELGLENSRTGEKTKLLEQGDEFLVSWRGSKKLLDWHLKNNVSRNPIKIFRLYYFWDDETQQTVVGSLPSHLRTRLT
ncbi:MAG: hypothetical protein F4114_14020 [Rhodospirillaceae bacterium]|nr:hypothetical protein [Rhodospirillaceae bacterium]